MKYNIEASCIECPLTFCCANCRRNHEKKVHGLEYECPLCRHQNFLCEPALIKDSRFLVHIVEEHLPLRCEKCDRFFTKMDDLVNIDQCVTISELVNNDEQVKPETEVDNKFEMLYDNSGTNESNQNEGENFEAIVSVDKWTRTAVITPIMRQKYLVDYDTSGSSEAEDITSPKSLKIKDTPYPKVASKTPRSKRTATPHVKKFLLRQRVVEDDEHLDLNHNTMDGSQKTVDVKNNQENDEEQLLIVSNEITTPTSYLASDRCAKIGSAVTTSTPTHPISGTWTIFPEQGADSPLSEIEGTTGESPAQSIDIEPSKSENSESVLPKLKSIIVTNSKIRMESQDSSEKQPTFQDSGSADVSGNKTKRVKFAEDTVFEPDRGPSRIFRKPKRVLTPGPQKPRFCFNPRFQALVNRFESQGKTMARTPNNVVRFSGSDQGTPAVGDNPVCPVRAIDFKEDSVVAELERSASTDRDCTGNEVYKSCIDSPKENENFVQVHGSWGLPAFMCDIYIAMDVTSSTSSIFNLVAISVDRYIAVTQPIKYAKHKNNKRVWFTIVLVWMVSAAIGAPVVLGLNDTPDRNYDECLFNSQNYVIYSSLGSFYIPCIMMMFLYYNIFKALRNRAKKQRAAKKLPVSGEATTGATTAVVIENVAQTRRLAETALHEDRPTNTGSGSNEDDHDDSFDKRSVELEADADECHVIPNDKSTEFMLATVTEETVDVGKNLKSPAQIQDPNGNNDSGYAASSLEYTIRDPVPTPPASPGTKHDAIILQNIGCIENGREPRAKHEKKTEQESRGASIALRLEEELETSQFDGRDGSSKKDRKASAATARFTIYKANKASKKKREKSSAKKERKATKTLAIVLGVFLFCWAPFFTCNVLDAVCGKLGVAFSPGVTAFILTTWLGYINSFLNPVIYTIFNPEFRKAFRKILHCGT